MSSIYLPHPSPLPPPPIPNGRPGESLSRLASDWGEGWDEETMTFQASQALAALDSEVKACVEGKVSLSQQPASLTFFAFFRLGRHLLGFILLEEVLFAKFLGL